MEKNMELKERLFNSMIKGHCCSQTIMSLCLEDLDKENEDLVIAMTAFCNGMGEGKICGTLAAAIAVLHVANTEEATDSWQDELMDWFYDSFGDYDCYGIIGDDDRKQISLCPVIIEETYLKLREYIFPEE